MSENRFPYNLKFLRKKYNLSQEALAKKINVSKQTISKYEKGIAEPNFHTLIEISRCFNCSLDSLVFGKVSSDNKSTIELSLLLEDKFNSLLQKEIIFLKNEISLLKNETHSLINNYLSSNINIDKTETEYAHELCFDTDTKVIDFDFYKNTKIIKSPSYFNLKNKDDFFKLPFVGHVSAGYPQYAYEDIEDFFYIPKEYIKSNEDDYFILRIKGESMNKLYKNGDYVLIRKTCCVEGQDPSVVLVNNEEATVKYVKFDDEYFYLQPYSDHPNFQENTSYKTDENTISVIGTVIGVVFREG